VTNLQDETTGPAASPEAGQRWLPALLLLFVGSGCAALIYEVVWFQLLQLSIGSSAVSLGVLLGIYMGGMCLGSLLLPKYLNRLTHPLRVYAMLEIGIAVFGIIVLFAVPIVGRIYTSIAGTGQVSLVLRAIVAAICLLPPTLLMGATLPAIARWVETTPKGVSWLGYFYGGNLAGAVAGSLLAGFYLLRVYDMPTATGVAVALNVVVALLALLVAARTPHTVITAMPSDVPLAASATAEVSRLVYIAIALSGLTALGSEVVWTRVLSLLFGATTYTFSLILAVFLVGLGIGSSLGSSMARNLSNPRIALGWCQLALCACLAWAAYTTSASLPYWPINPSISTSLSYNFQLDLMRAIWVMLPGAILWGASFPLALASVGHAWAGLGSSGWRRVCGQHRRRDHRRDRRQPCAGGHGREPEDATDPDRRRGHVGPAHAHARRRAKCGKPLTSTPVVVIGIALIAGLLARSVPPIPWLLVAYGRYSATWVGQNELVYVGEGVTASVAVTRTPTGVLNYHNAGKVQGLKRAAGHAAPAHARPHYDARAEEPEQGAGDRLRRWSHRRRGLDRSDGEGSDDCRDRAARFRASSPPTSPQHNFNVVANPKVKVHLDDARHYLLTTSEKFDAITSDPLDPWVKGAATLYTREFFDVVKSHLNPGGVVTLFVQLYESSEAAVKSEIGTFLEAFPNGAVFANTVNGQGYDLVLFGQLDGGKINVDTVQARLSDPANAAVAKSLSEVGINSAVDLFGTFAGRRGDMKTWLSDAQINTDRNLKLQYLAGLGLNLYQSDAIYKAMIREAKYPQDLFEGSPETLTALKAKIDASLSGVSSF
jgi:spermidine synthase